MKRSTFAVLLCLVMAFSFVSAIPSAAQSGEAIKYGDVISGRLTSDETTFTFTAEDGDFAAIQLIPSIDDGLFGGEVRLTDAGGTEIASSKEVIIFGRLGEILFVELPDAGDYTIVVGVGSSSGGGFEVALDKATLLEVGKAVEGEAVSTPDNKRSRLSNFYVVDSRDDATLAYTRGSGNYAPFVVIHTIERGNTLFARGFMGGEIIANATLTIEGNRDFRVVTVGASNFGQNGSGNEETGAFSLVLEAAK